MQPETRPLGAVLRPVIISGQSSINSINSIDSVWSWSHLPLLSPTPPPCTTGLACMPNASPSTYRSHLGVRSREIWTLRGVVVEGRKRAAATADEALNVMDRMIATAQFGQQNIARRLGLNDPDVTCWASSSKLPEPTRHLQQATSLIGLG
jgi:hypothetical protein